MAVTAKKHIEKCKQVKDQEHHVVFSVFEIIIERL